MILIGQYDSSFVRRVGIALRLYELPFEHRPWSVGADAAAIAAYNPLCRVPTLVLDEGDVLIDGNLILAHLEGLVPPERSLFPGSQPDRQQAFRVVGLATGMMEKAVSVFYERIFHDSISESWVSRCRHQIAGALAALEADRRERTGEFWFGDRIGHADISVAAVVRHMSDSVPDMIDIRNHPALAEHAAQMEAMPVFLEIFQPFTPPA